MCLHACSYTCVSMWYSAIDTIEYSYLSKKVKSEQENKVWRIMLGVVIYINRTDKKHGEYIKIFIAGCCIRREQGPT